MVGVVHALVALLFALSGELSLHGRPCNRKVAPASNEATGRSLGSAQVDRREELLSRLWLRPENS
jgi:hypothetical protein